MNRIYDFTLSLFAGVCGLLLIASVAVMLGFLVGQGGSVLGLKLIFGSTDFGEIIDIILLRQVVINALWPALIGTFLLVFTALITALPLGLGVGVYLAEYAGKPAKVFFSLIFDLLAGVPSIVIGLFGFSVTIYLHSHFSDLMPCLLISGMSLALLVLPYLVRTTQSALEELPSALRVTSFALGAEKSSIILLVLLPQALPGIFSGIVLAIGRAAEDTAVIMLTGVVASAGIPRSIFDNYEALPFYIYHTASQFSNQHELQQGIGAALVLLIICTLLFTGAGLLRKKATHHFLYHSK